MRYRDAGLKTLWSGSHRTARLHMLTSGRRPMAVLVLTERQRKSVVQLDWLPYLLPSDCHQRLLPCPSFTFCLFFTDTPPSAALVLQLIDLTKLA
jgi:hypothetical protein